MWLPAPSQGANDVRAVVEEPIIRLQSISKTFPGGVAANRSANLRVTRGEIHAIVGENGAGKSTLMNILYGLHQPDSGDIYLRGERVNIGDPRAAKRLGIGMVHQHFMLAPSFTVLENIILGYEPRRLGVLVDRHKAATAVQELCDRYHLSLPLHNLVSELPVGLQQRAEIVKAIYRGAECLILDEPTAVLTPLEVKELFAICREMSRQGKTILFISHKLREVLSLSHQITVMRGGETLAPVLVRETSEKELARMIVGRDHLWALPQRKPFHDTRTVLEVENLFVRGRQSQGAVRDVSMEVCAGEILGVAGVEGNGQSELMAALAGLLPVGKGALRLEGQDITRASVAQRRGLGIRHIPEDRMGTGLSLKATLAENLIIDTQNSERFTGPGGVLYWDEVERYANQVIEDYKIVAPHASVRAGSLSGGNLQKVVAARELYSRQRCLLVLHPTRGLDIGAAEFIYKRLLEAREGGAAILLVSADLDEIFMLSDRIVVMYEGRIAGEFFPGDVSPETVGLYMTGVGGQTQGEEP